MPFDELKEHANTLKIIKRSTTTETIHGILEEAILKGKLKGGEPLPTEELAALFNVSRMPIREALRELAAEGLVTILPYRGARVTEVSAREAEELAEVRVEIEKLALQRVIPISKERLERLESIVKQLEMLDIDRDTAFELNDAFHIELYKDIENRFLFELVQDLRSKMDRYTRIFTIVLGSMKQIAKEHRLIVEFCKTGDINKAGEALEKHIFGFKNRLVDYLKSQGLN